MADIDQLLGRIDAEFSAMKQRVETHREKFVEEFQGRKQRLDLFAKVCERLRKVWTPPLEAGQKVRRKGHDDSVGNTGTA